MDEHTIFCIELDGPEKEVRAAVRHLQIMLDSIGLSAVGPQVTKNVEVYTGKSLDPMRDSFEADTQESA